ncbi:MAG: formate dehydrogenase accessory protein FdhE [Hydrogenophilaceae bacterium]|nr:formate dehydrogenase accessory protein FdhE [Hydrogenophilaceae bacterium]
MSTTILQPGQIEGASGDIPELRLPSADLFGNRARRLRQLAEGHSLADYLRFLAALAEAQQLAVGQLGDLPLPSAGQLEQCRAHHMPPLTPAGWARDPIWRSLARQLAAAVRTATPAAGQAALDRIVASADDWLEAQAALLLESRSEGLDLACAPILGAALQVYWSQLAHRLTPAQVARPEYPNLCPVCGSHPVASVARIGGAENGLRYLHCALCESEWHVVRAKCSNCDNTKDIAYYSIEGGDGAVRAEACPECHSYLKIVHQDKDPNVDPVADDLASLALDLLMGEHGYATSGANLLMIHGSET